MDWYVRVTQLDIASNPRVIRYLPSTISILQTPIRSGSMSVLVQPT